MAAILATYTHRRAGVSVELTSQDAVDRFFDNRKPEDWQKT